MRWVSRPKPVFDPTGRITSLLRSQDGVTTVRSNLGYDAAGRIASSVHSDAADTILARYDFAFDDGNGLTSLTTLVDGTTSYTYDPTGQIVDVDHTNDPLDESFHWDATGNLDGEDDTVETGNELAATADFEFEYDAAGNRIRQTDLNTEEYRVYHWDHRGRLKSVEYFNASDAQLKTVEFGYDALNRRIGKRTIESGTTTEESYLLHGEHIMATLSEGDVTRVIMHGTQIDMVLAEEVFNSGGTSTVSWTLTDHLGSIRDVAELDSVTGFAVITQHVDYTAFGEIASGNLSTLFSYTGRQFDVETGIYHYRARYYDAVLGRFISKDPIGFAAGDVNWYRYVGNHPSFSRDPSGLIDDESLIMRNPANRPPPLSPSVLVEPEFSLNRLCEGVINFFNPSYQPTGQIYTIDIPSGSLVVINSEGSQDTGGFPSGTASTWPETISLLENHEDRPSSGWPGLVVSGHGSVNGGIRTGPRIGEGSAPRPGEMHIGGNLTEEESQQLLSLLAPNAPIIFSGCSQTRDRAEPLENLLILLPGHPIVLQPNVLNGITGGLEPWYILQPRSSRQEILYARSCDYSTAHQCPTEMLRFRN